MASFCCRSSSLPARPSMRSWSRSSFRMLRRGSSGDTSRRRSREPERYANHSASSSLTLEILHIPLVLFGGASGLEGAEVAAPLGLGVDFSRIQPVFAAAQFSNHDHPPQPRHRQLYTLMLRARMSPGFAVDGSPIPMVVRFLRRIA